MFDPGCWMFARKLRALDGLEKIWPQEYFIMDESSFKELVELSARCCGCIVSGIDIEVMIGAALGAWLIMSGKRNSSIRQRLTTLFLSAGAGYIFAPMAMEIAPVFTAGGAAFGCALIVVPIGIKVNVWVRQADLPELIKRLRGGR